MNTVLHYLLSLSIVGCPAFSSLSLNQNASLVNFITSPSSALPPNSATAAKTSATRARQLSDGTADITPVIYARPSTVVVDVFELNNVNTSGPVTVKLSKDPHTDLSFNSTATSIGGRSVNNSAWTFSGPTDGYYTLTTNQVIAGGGKLSFGLDSKLTSGETKGQVVLNAVIVNSSGGDKVSNNNTDLDTIAYFQQ